MPPKVALAETSVNLDRAQPVAPIHGELLQRATVTALLKYVVQRLLPLRSRHIVAIQEIAVPNVKSPIAYYGMRPSGAVPLLRNFK